MMYLLRKGLFAFSLAALLMIAGVQAAAQCEAEGNESEATATAITYQEIINDCVSSGNTEDPSEFEDPYDYYVLDIPAGDDVYGEIIFYSPVTSTVLRIWSADTGIWYVSDIFTNDEVSEYTIEIPEGALPSGTYYARVFFWSNACYDHEYTLTIDLEAEGGSTEGPQVMLNTDLFARVPWPMDSGDPRNNHRSTYSGLTNAGYNVISKDVDVVPHNPYLPGEKKYEGLLVSNDDRIYFLESKTMAILAYSLTGGFPAQSTIQSSSYKPPCLDRKGEIYYIHGENLANLPSYPARQSWSEELQPGVYKNVMCVGDRIYTSVEGQHNYVQVWLNSGNQACEVEVYGAPVGVAEAPFNKDFYVQTDDWFYKFSSNGTEQWKTQLVANVHAEQRTREIYGPILGTDNRIWLNDAMEAKWYIFDYNGNIVESDWFHGHSPVAACMRADGTLFIAYDDQSAVQYYSSDWTNEHITYQYDGALVDMICDGDGTVYFCYLSGDGDSYLWRSLLDDPYLTSIYGVDTGIPSYLCDPEYGVGMAIGEGGKLIFLHEKGWLSVFQGSPMWTTMPGILELGRMQPPGQVRKPPGLQIPPKPKKPKEKKPPKKKDGR